MEHLNNIEPGKVLEKYIEMYEDPNRWEDEELIKDWTKTFGIWMTAIRKNAALGNRNEMKLSLNRTNYRGKKTRALLAVMGEEAPGTLKELKRRFVKRHRDK